MKPTLFPDFRPRRTATVRGSCGTEPLRPLSPFKATVPSASTLPSLSRTAKPRLLVPLLPSMRGSSFYPWPPPRPPSPAPQRSEVPLALPAFPPPNRYPSPYRLSGHCDHREKPDALVTGYLNVALLIFIHILEEGGEGRHLSRRTRENCRFLEGSGVGRRRAWSEGSGRHRGT